MINPTKEMIVLKGEIKTSSVQSCLYNRGTQKWDVIFTKRRVSDDKTDGSGIMLWLEVVYTGSGDAFK